MTKIILVRHCEAMGNTKSVFQGRSDCDISGNGQMQLELLARRSCNWKLDALYSSPLKRAYRTAEAINKDHHLEIRTDDRLQEIDGGDYEGKHWDDLPRLFPDAAEHWYKNPGAFQAPGGESMAQVYGRVWEALEDIAAKNPGKTVCVTSHGCAIRNMLCRALGKPLEQMNDVDWGDNTSISILVFEDGTVTVERMNDAAHLPKEASVFQQQDWWKRENMK